MGYAKTYYPNLVKVLDTWYPSVTDANGLLDKGMNGTGGYGDYAFLPRGGEVTYDNALYVLALKDAAALAGSLGHGADAAAWTRRAQTVSAAINARLWDPSVGAYLDSDTGAVGHPQDGNGVAVIAGVASPSRAASALGCRLRRVQGQRLRHPARRPGWPQHHHHGPRPRLTRAPAWPAGTKAAEIVVRVEPARLWPRRLMSAGP